MTIHQDADPTFFRDLIYDNLIAGMKLLVEAMDTFELCYYNQVTIVQG